MEKEQNNVEAQRAAIEAKLQQAGITETDLNKAGYFRKTFWDFLQTERGSQFVESMVNFINGLTGKIHRTHTHETYVKFGCIIAVVGAVSVLSWVDRFDPSVGVLFGSIIGYLFGKNNE